MYKKDLILNNLEWLVCHKTKLFDMVWNYIIVFLLMFPHILKSFKWKLSLGNKLNRAWSCVDRGPNPVFH